MLRAGIGLYVPIDKKENFVIEAGYNQWLWGRSARRYREPYLSLGMRF